jgi:hypothetical protein
MTTTTYSFSDTNIVIAPPGYPAYTLNGQGIGEITVSYINDNTAHNLAADGNVMVSKIKANNANVNISAQQTSTLHQYLKDLFNYLMASPTNFWASTYITIKSKAGTFDDIQLSGVSFTKRSDQPFQQQGQSVTWPFMVAEAQTLGSKVPSVALSTQATIVRGA